MVECGGLENRYPRKGIIGSNPILSVFSNKKRLRRVGSRIANYDDRRKLGIGFEGSTGRKYDRCHIYSAGGRPETKWRAPNPILSVCFRLVFPLLLASLFLSTALHAEIIQLKNGNAIETKILKENDEFLVVQAPGGKVKIPKGDIKAIWRGSKEQLMEVRGKEVYFAKGVELYKNGKFKEAAASFEQSLGPKALGAIIYGNLGSAYAAARMDSKAEANFRKALQAAPENYDNLLNAAHFCESRKIFPKAVELYEKCLIQKPDDMDLTRSLAYCRYMKHDFLRAAELFERLGEKNDVVAKCDAAAAYNQAGELDKSEAILGALLKEPFPVPRVYFNMATLCELRKDYDQAESYYKKGLKYDPATTEIYLGLGQMYAEKKDWNQAETSFSQVLKKDPHNPEALYGLSQVFVEKKDATQAVAFYEKLLEKNSKDPHLLGGLGLLYLRLNEPKRALKVYQKIFEIRDRDAKAHANAGLAYALLNDADNALKEWNRALQLDPKLRRYAKFS